LLSRCAASSAPPRSEAARATPSRLHFALPSPCSFVLFLGLTSLTNEQCGKKSGGKVRMINNFCLAKYDAESNEFYTLLLLQKMGNRSTMINVELYDFAERREFACKGTGADN
ncbi:MAG: hypothetical protein IJ438_09150, partial [Clostridia bacterium]|nr:hypothetical protein [Clostridia bacterium]